jgi:hypothetical protein
MFQTPYERMLKWIQTIPNDGLIRFYVIGNLERVLLTSPKALSELLVTKVYDFEKPDPVRNNLRRVTGDGILLAEGDEHKVRQRREETLHDFFLTLAIAPTQEPDAGICLPPHQGSVPHLLGQERRNGETNRHGFGAKKAC